jgi:hypothetical protein
MTEEEEFNLSEKLINQDSEYCDNGFYWEKDVKEFIKRLKKEKDKAFDNFRKEGWFATDIPEVAELRLQCSLLILDRLDEIIDKLAGEKLK